MGLQVVDDGRQGGDVADLSAVVGANLCVDVFRQGLQVCAECVVEFSCARVCDRADDRDAVFLWFEGQWARFRAWGALLDAFNVLGRGACGGKPRVDFSSIVVDAFVCKPFQDNVRLLVERLRWQDEGEVSTALDNLERFAVVDWGARDERDGGSVAAWSHEPSDGCVSAFVNVEEHNALFSS